MVADAVNHVPIHSSGMTITDTLKARVAEGVQIAIDRFKQAISTHQSQFDKRIKYDTLQSG